MWQDWDYRKNLFTNFRLFSLYDKEDLLCYAENVGKYAWASGGGDKGGGHLPPLDFQKSGFSEPKYKNLFKMNGQNEKFTGGCAP